jgi:putative aminopeptidase FrvX
MGKEDKQTPLQMGRGFTLLHGTVCSPALNRVYEDVAKEHGIPMQHDVRGGDSGTDAMAGVRLSDPCCLCSAPLLLHHHHSTFTLLRTVSNACVVCVGNSCTNTMAGVCLSDR